MDYLQEMVPLMSEDMVQQVAEWYEPSRFWDVFKFMITESKGRPDSNWGEPLSAYYRAARRIIELGLTDPAIRTDLFVDVEDDGDIPPDFEQLLPLVETQWIIPTESELDAIVAAMWTERKRTYGKQDTKEFWDSRPEREKCGFSATAAAIHFLSSIPTATRQYIRQMFIIEDKPAVASSALHVHGLVPLCHENPSLCIERRVSLWKNIFVGKGARFGAPRELKDPHFRWDGFIIDGMFCYSLTTAVAPWIVEAALARVPDAITLVLDGEPAPELSAHIFQDVIHRDAAWQATLEQTMMGGELADTIDKRIHKILFQCDGFPELLRDIVALGPKSRVRCNFDPGRPWDSAQIADLVYKYRHLDIYDWEECHGELYDYIEYEAPPDWTYERLRAQYIYTRGSQQ